MENDVDGRRKLLNGLLKIYAEQENQVPEKCSLKRPLEYIDKIISLSLD